MEKTRCQGCRKHSLETRRAPTTDAVANGDGELEIVEFEDDEKPFIVCRAGPQPREVGFVHLTPGAGVGCELFEAPPARRAPTYACRCASRTGVSGEECSDCGGRVSA